MNIKLIVIIAVIVTAILFFGVALPANKTAEMTGSNLGENVGKAVGWVNGSVKGFTEGRSEGAEAGKAEGLSAKDTIAELEGTITQVGILEVLYADLKMHNVIAFGADGEETKDYSQATYCALYISKGTGVFSVDLNKMQVEAIGKNITISIPMPKVTIEPKGDAVKLSEFGKKNAGSTQNGVIGAVNSIKNVYSESKNTLENEDELMEMAKSSAQQQIRMLAENVCGNDKIIEIEFFEEGENS